MSDAVIISIIGVVATLGAAAFSWAGSRAASRSSRNEAEDNFSLESVQAASEEWKKLYDSQREEIKRVSDDVKRLAESLARAQSRLDDLERSHSRFAAITQRVVLFLEWLRGVAVFEDHAPYAPEPLESLLKDAKTVLNSSDK